jgi:LacI family transcriptional regulator
LPANQPSITDIARLLGLSVSGVSRALNNDPRISAATKKRVLEAAAEINYQPNNMATGLRRGKSKLVGVIVPYVDGRFFAVVIKGIERAARAVGFNVIICQSDEDVEHERQNIETLLQSQVEGILISISLTTHDSTHFAKVQQRGVPLVFFDRVLRDQKADAIVINDYAGGFESTTHLLQQGYHRIAHLAGAQQLDLYYQRRLGYLGALQAHGILPDERLIAYCEPITLETGRQAMESLLQLPDPPDAVFSASDWAVAGALQVLEERGLRVPHDIGLAGFSNETFTTLTKPRLTSVEQHGEQIGEQAFQLMLRLRQREATVGPQRLVIEPSLQVRASSQRNSLK